MESDGLRQTLSEEQQTNNQLTCDKQTYIYNGHLFIKKFINPHKKLKRDYPDSVFGKKGLHKSKLTVEGDKHISGSN